MSHCHPSSIIIHRPSLSTVNWMAPPPSISYDPLKVNLGCLGVAFGAAPTSVSPKEVWHKSWGWGVAQICATSNSLWPQNGSPGDRKPCNLQRFGVEPAQFLPKTVVCGTNLCHILPAQICATRVLGQSCACHTMLPLGSFRNGAIPTPS